jgi:ABC-type transport system involved in multi-copper enzyme maturation permease subunit
MSGERGIVNRLVSQPWRLWWSQLRTIVGMEYRRNLFSRRALWVYFIAFAPTAIIALHAVSVRDGNRHTITDDTDILAGIFQFYYVRLAIFFGALGIATRLIRGEMVEHSLHYYLLAPVRREVLLLGKFTAGVIGMLLIFEAAVFASFTFMYSHFGPRAMMWFFDGPGAGHLKAYLGITALACIGYTAVFMLLSMLFKNPAPAAMLVLLWEVINPILPALFQKISIASYIRHLTPVAPHVDGIFALLMVVTEPVPAWVATAGVLAVTAAILITSCYFVRRLEISYTGD